MRTPGLKVYKVLPVREGPPRVFALFDETGKLLREEVNPKWLVDYALWDLDADSVVSPYDLKLAEDAPWKRT